jgi:hypothetical protein
MFLLTKFFFLYFFQLSLLSLFLLKCTFPFPALCSCTSTFSGPVTSLFPAFARVPLLFWFCYFFFPCSMLVQLFPCPLLVYLYFSLLSARVPLISLVLFSSFPCSLHLYFPWSSYCTSPFPALCLCTFTFPCSLLVFLYSTFPCPLLLLSLLSLFFDPTPVFPCSYAYVVLYLLVYITTSEPIPDLCIWILQNIILTRTRTAHSLCFAMPMRLACLYIYASCLLYASGS